MAFKMISKLRKRIINVYKDFREHNQLLSDLYLSVAKGNIKEVELLIERGVNLNHKYSCNETILFLASLHGDDDIIELLLDNGANIDAKDSMSNTALMKSIILENSSFNFLIGKGANINVQNKYGETLLANCAKYFQTDKVEILISKGVNVNIKDKSDRYGYDHAVINNSASMMYLFNKQIVTHKDEKWRYTVN